jgi:Flp pilus assembly protein TadD
LAWATAVVALLPPVLQYAAGTVDDWWDLAFVRSYVDRDALRFDEPMLGTQSIHPRFAWNSWLVLQALITRFSGVDSVDLQAQWMAPFVCCATVAANGLLAVTILGRERRWYVPVAMLAVPFWLYGTEALPYFTRLHQDKFLAGLILVPGLVSVSAEYVKTGGKQRLVLVALAAMAVASVHGLLCAIGMIGCGACLIAAMASPDKMGMAGHVRQPRRVVGVRALAVGAAASPALLYPVWQAWTLSGRLSGQGIGLESADNPVVRAHLWLDRLILPDSAAMIVNPAAVFGPIALLAGVGLIHALRNGHGRRAPLLAAVSLLPCALIFLPFVAGLLGRLTLPWMLYRVGWLVPVPLLLVYAVDAVDAKTAGKPFVRRATLVALAAVAFGLVVPIALDRARRGMLEHPEDRKRQPYGTTRELYRFIAAQPGDGPVLAPPGLASLMPALAGRPVVAMSERATLVFSEDEAMAYARLRDSAAFLSARSSIADRDRIASRYAADLAVFRRGYASRGGERELLESSSAEGFLLATAEEGAPSWPADTEAVRRQLSNAWQVVFSNRDFIVVAADRSRLSSAVSGPEKEPLSSRSATWLEPFELLPQSDGSKHAGEVVGSLVGFPGAVVNLEPAPFSLGFSDQPVWTTGPMLWDDGPSEVKVELGLEQPCRVRAIEVVPYLPTGRREVFEISAMGASIQAVARNHQSILLAVPTTDAQSVVVWIRSLVGFPFGLDDVRVIGDIDACAGGWTPRGEPLTPDERVPSIELSRIAWSYPGSIRGHQAIARRLARAGNRNDARAVLTLGLAQNPRVAAAWVDLGQMFEDDGEPEAAVDAYRAALSADSNNAWARGCMAWALVRRGDLVRAAVHAWRATRLDPNYADAYTILGSSLDRLGMRRVAINLLERAIQIDRRRNWAYLEMARILVDEGRDEDALRLLSEFLVRVPNDPGVRAWIQQHDGMAHVVPQHGPMG